MDIQAGFFTDLHTYIHTYFIGSSPRGFSESILHYKIINQVQVRFSVKLELVVSSLSADEISWQLALSDVPGCRLQ